MRVTPRVLLDIFPLLLFALLIEHDLIEKTAEVFGRTLREISQAAQDVVQVAFARVRFVDRFATSPKLVDIFHFRDQSGHNNCGFSHGSLIRVSYSPINSRKALMLATVRLLKSAASSGD